MEKIMNMDSDGDGFINRIEIEKGTNPGDPADFPGSQKKSGSISIWILTFLFSIIIITVLFYIKKRKMKND